MDLYFIHGYRQIHVWFFHEMKGKLVDTLPPFYPIFWKTVSAERPLGKTKKPGIKRGSHNIVCDLRGHLASIGALRRVALSKPLHPENSGHPSGRFPRYLQFP